jgi:hypothetical protein
VYRNPATDDGAPLRFSFAQNELLQAAWNIGGQTHTARFFRWRPILLNLRSAASDLIPFFGAIGSHAELLVPFYTVQWRSGFALSFCFAVLVDISLPVLSGAPGLHS